MKIIAFHGGQSIVKRFDPRRRKRAEYGEGYYFTDDPELANRFGPVVEAYELRLRRPLVARQFGLLDDLTSRSGEQAPRELRKQGTWITKMARRLGHDGIEVAMATGQRYYVAFRADQINHVVLPPPPPVPVSATKFRARIGKPEPAF